MDIGGRVLELRHLGRGHTDGDLVVLVPDAGVLLAGDLVEEGAPPSFEDSYPLEWPETLAALLHLAARPPWSYPATAPPVDPDFVQAQHDELTQLAWLIRDGHADGRPTRPPWRPGRAVPGRVRRAWPRCPAATPELAGRSDRGVTVANSSLSRAVTLSWSRRLRRRNQ